MDLDKIFSTDKDLENNGVWVNIGDDCELKIARLHNDKFKKLYATYSKQSKIVSKHINDMPEAVLIEMVAKTVLIDWAGVKIGGEELEYSVDNAIKILTEYYDFLSLVVELANERETFRRIEIEEGKENLKKS